MTTDSTSADKNVTPSSEPAPAEAGWREELAPALAQLKERMDMEREEENLAFEIIQVGKERELSRRLSQRFQALERWAGGLARIVREQAICIRMLTESAGGSGPAETRVSDRRRGILLDLAQDTQTRGFLALAVFKPPAVSADGLIDCSGLVSQCLARCCKRAVPLTLEEAESGRYEWSDQEPFCLVREEDGYCKYLRRDGSFSCSIFEVRPEACRTFFCDAAVNSAGESGEPQSEVPSEISGERNGGVEQFRHPMGTVDDLISPDTHHQDSLSGDNTQKVE